MKRYVRKFLENCKKKKKKKLSALQVGWCIIYMQFVGENKTWFKSNTYEDPEATFSDMAKNET